MLEENPKELIGENMLLISDEDSTQEFLDRIHRATDILEGIRNRTANYQMLSLAFPQLRENGISDDLCELLDIRN